MSPVAKRDAGLVVGGVPRAELLPPELKLEEKARSERKGLLAIVALVMVLVVAVYGFVLVLGQTSAHQLQMANQHTADLLTEQSKYVSVRQLGAKVAASNQARELAMSTDVDWKAVVVELEAILQSLGASTGQFEIKSSTPFEAIAPSSILLEQPRVAEITFVAVTGSYPLTADFLEALSTMTGFADASVSTIRQSGSTYEASITLHLNSEIYTNRFSKEALAAAEAEGAAADGGDTVTATEGEEVEVTP